MIGSRGTQTKFVSHIVESLCAKFGAFFHSVTIFSLNHLTIAVEYHTSAPYSLENHAGDFLVSKRLTAYVGLVSLQKFEKL